jgi:hypothetical protein
LATLRLTAFLTTLLFTAFLLAAFLNAVAIMLNLG